MTSSDSYCECDFDHEVVAYWLIRVPCALVGPSHPRSRRESGGGEEGKLNEKASDDHRDGEEVSGYESGNASEKRSVAIGCEDQ